MPTRKVAAAQDPYWWIQGPTVNRLRDALNDAGDDARVEIHPFNDGQKIHIIVVPLGRPAKDPINESHICPPDCG